MTTTPPPSWQPASPASASATEHGSYTFAEAVSRGFSKYATFSGRARRSEFWYFWLFTALVGIAAKMIDSLIFGAAISGRATAGVNMIGSILGVVSPLASIALLIPTLAVTFRRLHDTDRSGFWALLPSIVGLAGLLGLVISFATGLSVAFSSDSGEAPPEALATAVYVGAGLSVAALVAYAVLLIIQVVFLASEGTAGPNKYGSRE